VPHPDRLPDLFLDRSLGRIAVPTILRAADLRLVTLAERYGVPADEGITDVEWISDAGRRGEVVFLKDGRVRYNEAEKAAIVEFEVRCFCLSRRDLPAAEMAARFLGNLPASLPRAKSKVLSFTPCTPLVSIVCCSRLITACLFRTRTRWKRLVLHTPQPG
jgi:hypothetical protein